MAKKSKSKKGKKAKNKPKKKLWCTEDLHFDEDGNLCVTNAALSKAISKAIYRTDRRFCIRVNCVTDSDQPGVADAIDDGKRKAIKTADGQGGGRPPMDAMCPC